MTYEITDRREVPVSRTDRGIIIGKTVTTNLVNGGKKAICVKLNDGRTAWGFGESVEIAEKNAVHAAMEI